MHSPVGAQNASAARPQGCRDDWEPPRVWGPGIIIGLWGGGTLAGKLLDEVRATEEEDKMSKARLAILVLYKVPGTLKG